MTSAFSWQNCQPLPYFILYSKAKLACYSRCLLTSCFCILVPCDEKDIFFWCQFQKVLQVLLKSIDFSFLSISGWCTDLDCCDVERFTLETNGDHSVIFEMAPKYFISDSLVDYDGYSISSKGFLPTVVDIWSSELNSPIPVHFISLISKMSVFILAMSCLTTSSFPYFMDLPCQVLMQYCSLQHWTFLSPPENIMEIKHWVDQV